MSIGYDFNPNLAEASTLPSHWYFESEFLKKDYTKIFNRTWNLVGRADQLRNPGDYITSTIGQENVVIVRDEAGKLRGHSNVCRHRAGPIAVGAGNTKSLRCLYHAWTYGLDGKLIAAPEFQGVQNFDKETCQLPPVQVESYGPLVFAALNPRMSFAEYFGTIPKDLEYLSLENMRYYASKDYPVKANWKTYCDNFLEGYHLPAVHPDLTKELDMRNYVVDTFRWYSTQDSPPRSSSKYYAGSEKPGAHYYWLFPNLMFNIYQGMLQTNLVIPVSEDECVVHFDWYLRGDRYDEVAQKMPALMKFSDQVQEEDRMICESVQKNLKSVAYTQGRYSVKRENGVHHFHGLVSEMYRD